MKKILVSLVALTFAATSFASVVSYSCSGKSPYGEKITAEIQVNGSDLSFNGKAARYDSTYTPRGRKDMVRFKFPVAECSDLCSSGVLVSKDVLAGVNKVFLVQEWSGEGYQSDNYVCFSKTK